MCNVEDLANLAKIRILALERERRRASGNLEARHLCQHVQEFLRQTLGKEGLVALLGKVLESKDGDGLVVDGLGDCCLIRNGGRRIGNCHFLAASKERSFHEDKGHDRY
jgi:hypothetical protein